MKVKSLREKKDEAGREWVEASRKRDEAYKKWVEDPKEWESQNES